MDKKALELELEKIIEISIKYGAQKVYLFGSCLFHPDEAMDIDVAVEGIAPNKFYPYYGEVLMNISSNVDVVDIADMRDHFRNRIIETGKVLYES